MISCHDKTMTIVGNMHEIIPISFNMYQILDDNYYNENYLVQTRSQAKSSGTKLLGSPWCEKEFRSQSQARKTTCHAHKNGSIERLHIGHGKSWIKKKENLSPSINQLRKHPTCHRKFLED